MTLRSNYASSYYFDLAGSLQEFGLSKYEAMAYITLVSKGTLGASEIAYYSTLPRTKIYPTLKKLERKKLSKISNIKPIIATAIPPSEAFGEIMTLHKKRLTNMRNIVDGLKKLGEDEKKSYIEERKYLILDPKAVVGKIKELIVSTKSNLNLMLDSWGCNVVFQSKPSLLECVRRGIKINMLIGIQSVFNENIGLLPNGLDIKFDYVSENILIFDFNRIICIDSTNGKAALLLTPDTFSNSYLKLFDERWEKAIKVNPTKLNEEISTKALILTKMIEGRLSKILFDISIKPDHDYMLIIGEIEKFCSGLNYNTIDDIINIIDYALKLSYSGYLKYDNKNNMLTIHSDANEKSIVPWALIIMSYMKKFGNNIKIIYDHEERKTNTIYIKLLSTTLTHVN